MKKRLFLPLLPAIALLAFAAPAGAAGSEAVSSNWAGYEATTNNSAGFSSVYANWTQPSVNCAQGSGSQYAAFWVGLGGSSEGSGALEQVGTQADCSANGSPSAYAWYELVPAAPVTLGVKISAGDHIYARTAVNGSTVTVTLTDHTSGQSATKTLHMTNPSPDTSSAEWIAEAPSQCSSSVAGEGCTPLSLADFGTVKFSDAHATAGGHRGTISDPNWAAYPIALSPGSTGYGELSSYLGTASGGGAQPGPLSDENSAFSVSYSGDSTGSTAGDGSGNGDGSGYPSSGGGYGGGGYGYGYGGYGDGGYGGYGDGGYAYSNPYGY